MIISVHVENFIRFVRGQKVILDADLATLYGVTTKALVQAVKRNRERFPDDFMVQLNVHDMVNLRSQIVTSSARADWGGRRYPPFAFTEHGVAMMSSILRSERAIRVNIEIMRAFVRLRQLLVDHAEVMRKINTMEKKHDARFKMVFDAIRRLMEPSGSRIGFHRE